MGRPTVWVITLGCKVNQCDGEDMCRALAGRGWRIAARGEAAEAFVVNTCTVTAAADAKARKLVRRLARAHPGATIVVTGCLAQRDPEAVADLPKVAAVVPNARKGEIADLLHLSSDPAPAVAGRPAAARTRAFVKVQDGCDQGCAYCAVPEARGKPWSKPLGDALAEVRARVEAGAREVVLCGIRLGAYQTPEGGLAALLLGLREVKARLRLSSLEPMDLGEGLLEEMAGHPRLCRHVHVPLQSGDDGVLAAMGRGYTAEEYRELVARLRAVWPEVAISTDVMAGFPGETPEQFARTARLLREVRFSRVHVFPYSARPGTPAARRRDQVAAAERRARAAQLLEVAEGLAREAAEAWVGREVEALVEERQGEMLSGLTEHYVRVRAPGPAAWVGRLVRLRAVAAQGSELRGEPVG